MHQLPFACRGAGQQSVSSLDDAEEALLQQPLAPGLAPVPAAIAASAEPAAEQYQSSDRTGIADVA